MTEQRKATSAGDHNAVTHETAPPTPEPEVSDAARRARRSSRITLAVKYPYREFDLSARDLPSVTQKGTTYSAAQADEVLTLARKHGVPLYVVTDDATEEK